MELFTTIMIILIILIIGLLGLAALAGVGYAIFYNIHEEDLGMAIIWIMGLVPLLAAILAFVHVSDFCITTFTLIK